MCPNCAAEYQYGAVSLSDFQDRVLALTIDKSLDDYIEFPIKMQGEDRILRYSPVHLLNLQTALNHFSGATSEEADIEEKEEYEKGQQNPSATMIKKIDSGDRCPDCGTQNNHSTSLSVIDRNGKKQRITGLLCQCCGTRYLTKRLFRMIVDPNLFNIVSVGSTKANKTPKKTATSSMTHKPTANTRKVIISRQTNKRETDRCRRCGTPGTVLGSGLCWDCYKDEKASMYDG